MNMTKTIMFVTLIMVAFITGGKVEGATCYARGTTRNNTTVPNRKLLISYESKAVAEVAKLQPKRILGETCSTSDIYISQGPSDPLPNGTPTYRVAIKNVCSTRCEISDIHVSCGLFSSAQLIEPRIFKRLRYDDCLVNGGEPLVYESMITFMYANTSPYPLKVSSVKC